MDKLIDCMPNIELTIALTKYRINMGKREYDKLTMREQIDSMWNMVCTDDYKEIICIKCGSMKFVHLRTQYNKEHICKHD